MRSVPGVIGLLRDASGSYSLPFYGCIGLELIAAVLIMVRGRAEGRLPSVRVDASQRVVMRAPEAIQQWSAKSWIASSLAPESSRR